MLTHPTSPNIPTYSDPETGVWLIPSPIFLLTYIISSRSQKFLPRNDKKTEEY